MSRKHARFPALGRAAAAVAAAAALTTGGVLAATALTGVQASTARPDVQASIVGDPDSAGQAGYQVSGAQFRTVHAATYLRAPGQYSPSLSGKGESVTLWASDGSVVQLGVSATTSPASAYSPAFAAFDAAHAQIAGVGSASVHDQFCTAANVCTPGSGSFAAGQNDTFQLFYDRASGLVHFTEFDAAGDTYTGTYSAGTGVSFSAARVTSDFGNGPWDQAAYTGPPAAQQKLNAWTGAGVTNYKGNHFPLTGYFATAGVTLTGAGSVVEARPGPLSATGTGFSTVLVP